MERNGLDFVKSEKYSYKASGVGACIARSCKNAQRGITLVALIISIIILLILAGVTISLTIGENGLFAEAKRAKQATIQAQKNEEILLKDIEDYLNTITISEKGYNETYGVNEPKLKTGMIPVYYENGVWKKADEKNTNKQWYDYENKQWANIVTVADSDRELREAEVGTEIPMNKITTFFVWIPRYAYSITSGYKQGSEGTGSIDITFLKGNTNVGVDGKGYETDYDETNLKAGDVTPRIVHPGFTFGDNQLTGIWVAKFEASGTNINQEAVGNASSSSSTPVAVDSTTYVKILPSVISWRHISTGEAQYQSMKMSSNIEKYGWTNQVNSHLIKNNEWGAVAYLCYSQYGKVPMTNGSGSTVSGSHWYDMYTGAGPNTASSEAWYGQENGVDKNGGVFTEEKHGYYTLNGQLSSTTGNVYGVYDMAGGAWERVAAYLDNGNNNLTNNGNSVTDKNIKYFKNNILEEAYSAYWNAYQVGEEEKSNKIKVIFEEGEDVEKEITQSQLWQNANFGENYQAARKRITDATYEKLPKGIGVSETANSHSFYGPYSETITEEDGTEKQVYKGWTWWKTPTTKGNATTWNKDYVLIGHASRPFVVRGGCCYYGAGAGVLCSNVAYGDAYSYGFRPVLAF